jgi:hypothetical protein
MGPPVRDQGRDSHICATRNNTIVPCAFYGEISLSFALKIRTKILGFTNLNHNYNYGLVFLFSYKGKHCDSIVVIAT